jgi:CubicO group peptidase (beta-lactamase class C family)
MNKDEHRHILQDYIDATQNIFMHGMVILSQGKKLCGHQWEPETRHNQYSISKSFTATAVGIAIDEGRLCLDDLVTEYLQGYLPSQVCGNLKMLTLRHLLSMSMGQKEAYLSGNQRAKLPSEQWDWNRFILDQKFEEEPGQSFLYNNAGLHLAGVIVQNLVGCSLVDYLMPRLFEPLEIYRPTWEVDPTGYTFGSCGLCLSVSEVAKFGQLFLQNGFWQGRQLISQTWVNLATKVHQKKDGQDPHRDGYGQYCFIIPEKQAVVAINAHHRGEEDMIKIFWETVYPHLKGR